MAREHTLRYALDLAHVRRLTDDSAYEKAHATAGTDCRLAALSPTRVSAAVRVCSIFGAATIDKDL